MERIRIHEDEAANEEAISKQALELLENLREQGFKYVVFSDEGPEGREEEVEGSYLIRSSDAVLRTVDYLKDKE